MFSVRWHDKRHPRDATEGFVTVDGISLTSRYIRADHGPYGEGSRDDVTYHGPTVSEKMRKTLVFSQLDLSGERIFIRG
jgi:hypothetical protein